jgi:hypothetical protein
MSARVPKQHTRAIAPHRNLAGLPRHFRVSLRNSFRRAHQNGWARTLRHASSVTVLGELLLVTSSVAVSLGLSRLALGELFRLVRIDSARSSHDAAQR